MALTIQRTALPDPPQWSEFTLAGILTSGYVTIDTNSATVQVLYGGQGEDFQTEPNTVPPGNYQLGATRDGKPLQGIRAQNAAGGAASYLTGYLWGACDPSFTFLSAATPPGGPVLIVPGFTLATWPPPAPTAGQLVFLDLPAATYNPLGGLDVRWLCSYDAVGLRWNVTGPPLVALTDILASRNDAAYGDLGGSVGPSMTCPLLGDYLITVGSECEAGNAGEDMFMSYDAGAGASDTNAWRGYASGSIYRGHATTVSWALNVPAGQVVTAKYRNAGGAGAQWRHRQLTITPLTFR